jgi:hypothetical protein
MRALALALLALASSLPPAASRCRFALDYTCESLQQPAPLAAFLLQYAQGQAAFAAADGVGVDDASGLTFDGHALDYATGALSPGGPHPFSAASKECIHVALLALAVGGSPLALAALGGAGRALDAAARKLASYTAFNASSPGYGCHLPWFETPSMAPVGDWASPPRVPALDNGELAWAVLALAEALGSAGHASLAAGYSAWFACMAGSARAIFFQPDGSVAAVAVVRNASVPPPGNAYAPDGAARLDDPYEGETMTVLLDLCSSLSAAQREAMWAAKRARLVAATYTSAAASGQAITAQAGWWFSSHENWKSALLPYAAAPTAARVLASTERARTHHALDHGWPALLASTTDVAPGPGRAPPGYVSAAGVQALALDRGAFRTDVAAPYGAWLVLLHNASAGACWLRSVLAAPRAQGPHGATEAVAVNGSLISPLMTWDTSMTTVLASAGGVAGLVSSALARLPAGGEPAAGAPQSALDRFLARIESEYAAKFPVVQGEGVGFALPAAAIPQAALSPWEACA